MPLSYAQYFEDVMRWRAPKDVRCEIADDRAGGDFVNSVMRPCVQ